VDVLFNGMRYFVVEAFRCVCIYCTVEWRQSHRSAIITERIQCIYLRPLRTSEWQILPFGLIVA